MCTQRGPWCMSVVAVVSVGQRCVIAARHHFGPVGSAKTLMSLVHHHTSNSPISIQRPSYFSKLLSLSLHGVLFSCAEQCWVGWFGGAGDGVAAEGGGVCVELFSSVETADRSSKPCTALVYVTSASGTTGQEEKPNISMCIFNSWQHRYLGRDRCSIWFVALWKALEVFSVHSDAQTMLHLYASIFTALPNIYAELIAHQNILHIMLLYHRTGQCNWLELPTLPNIIST